MWRPLLIILLLIGGLLAWGVYSKPVSCRGKWPWQLASLWVYLHQHRIAGIQLAGTDGHGVDYSCEIGRRADGQRLKQDDVLYYASLSKMLLVWTVLELEQRKQLALDAPVLTFLNAPVLTDPRWQQVTLRHLLTHHAGFDRALTPDPMFSKKPWCPNSLVTGVVTTVLDHAPGSTYRYANIGYCLLAEIVASRQETSVELLLREQFKLYGTKHIAVETNGANILADKTVVVSGSEQRWLAHYIGHAAVGAWKGSAAQWRDIWRQQLARSDVVAIKVKQKLFDGGCEGDVTKWRDCNHLGFYHAQLTRAQRSMLWRDGSFPGASAFSGFDKNGAFVVVIANQRQPDWMRLNDWLGQWALQLL